MDFQYLFNNPEGRISRSEWWAGTGILIVGAILLAMIFDLEGAYQMLPAVLVWGGGIMIHIKRCHDRDQSGWLCLLMLIPFIGGIWAIINLGMLPGTVGDNHYGPDPAASA